MHQLLNHKKSIFPILIYTTLILVKTVLKNHVPFKRYFKKSDLIFNILKSMCYKNDFMCYDLLPFYKFQSFKSYFEIIFTIKFESVKGSMQGQSLLTLYSIFDFKKLSFIKRTCLTWNQNCYFFKASRSTRRKLYGILGRKSRNEIHKELDSCSTITN